MNLTRYVMLVLVLSNVLPSLQAAKSAAEEHAERLAHQVVNELELDLVDCFPETDPHVVERDLCAAVKEEPEAFILRLRAVARSLNLVQADEFDKRDNLLFSECFEGDGWQLRFDLNAEKEHLEVAGFSPGPAPLLAGVCHTWPTLIQASKKKPKYPKKARRRRVEGKVHLVGIIRANGKVDSLVAHGVSPPGQRFENSAIKAVKRWRWNPSYWKGEPVAAYFTVIVEFSLN